MSFDALASLAIGVRSRHETFVKTEVGHEFSLGQELANAAVAAGVEHMVFSGLEHVEARTGGTKWARQMETCTRSLPIRGSSCLPGLFLREAVPETQQLARRTADPGRRLTNPLTRRGMSVRSPMRGARCTASFRLAFLGDHALELGVRITFSRGFVSAAAGIR